MDSPAGWRRLMLAIPVIAMLWGASLPARAQTLWKDTQVGMSLQSIQKQFPKAARPSQPTQLADGSRELLRLSDTDVQGHVFDALFFFRQGKLTQVSLELQEHGGAVSALQTFRSLKTAFDAKYGAPDEEQDRNFDAPTGPASFRSASWRSGRTWITLSYATAAGKLIVLNVAYRLTKDRKIDDI
jgi:hypothetical protein